MKSYAVAAKGTRSNQTQSDLQMPFQLKLNLLSNALGVSKKGMRFSWAVRDSKSNVYQTAYQLLIFKRAADFKEGPHVFDSGWVYSSKNTAVTIKDRANVLEDNELYYWTVRIKNNASEITSFAVPAAFSTAVGKEWADTRAIWLPDKKEATYQRNFVLLRSPSFDLDIEKVEKVVISASARDGNPLIQQTFDLFVNGKAAGYGPGRPHPRIREAGKPPVTCVFYNSFDVTDLIKNGKNTTAVLSTGTLFLKDGYNTIGDKSAGLKKQGMFLAQITIFFKDHSKQVATFTNDGHWKSLDGSPAFGFAGRTIGTQYFSMPAEDIDANTYPFGWEDRNFDDSAWFPAVSVKMIYDQITEVFQPFPSENTLRKVTHEPQKKVVKLANGDWLVDLGKEIIGGLYVNLDSDKDQKIDVFSGEQLNDDGTVRYHMACEPVYHETWSLIKGKQHFYTYTMKCFRFVQIHGYDGTLSHTSIKGWALQQPFDASVSSFTSSSDLLNREYELSKYTIRATNQDIYVDSQARERRPYEGDLLVNGNTSYAVSDQYSLARYSIDYLLDNETWPEDYKLFNVEFAWQDYLYTGDAQLLETRYPILKEKLLRGEQGTDNFDEQIGLVKGIGLIDWPKNERDGYVEGTYNTPFNAIYVGIYAIMAKIAAVIENHADESIYLYRSRLIKNRLIHLLFDTQTQTFFDSMNEDGSINKHCSLHASAYALAYQVIDPKVIDPRLTAFIGNEGVFKGSIYFAYFILRGLFNANAGGLAIQLLLNSDHSKDAKTFAAVLDQLNATIAPEAWSNADKPNLTLSHPWGATPGCMIVQGVFGIHPTSPGFDTFEIKVQPGMIESASVVTPSIKGPIRAAFMHTSSGDLIVDVAIPMNTRAMISIPFTDNLISKHLLVNGRPVASIHNGNFRTVELPSGQYRFEPLEN
ncbi:glycoside hydrolase family 78 protein [Sporolactobacillus shoreicorticis]|uniref:alpha-L-rhamnosidase n=1 Tax=Sporolactobacillus shoreicorticis TaxID=1923877 RepID=A0ABW5S185_9BACL|nr:family 78 glycoside hydrolase catalytic domain [Sporolactobacillus shoreicorticis]MCO7124719.1 glycoside hydrolase family 78 protein [Sporolactobacillus shoreicorticis]